MDGGGLRLVTEDDTWVNQVGRPLGLDEASLRSHPMRHLLTRAIGAAPSVSVKTYDVPLEGESVLLLCTDGLHGVVDGTVIERVLREAGDGVGLAACCRALVDAAIRRGSPDNVTVVLVKKARVGKERRQER
jgi:protein phosphatase